MGATGGTGWQGDSLSYRSYHDTPRKETDALEGFFEGITGMLGGIAIGAGILGIIALGIMVFVLVRWLLALLPLFF
ncbi:MAG: hypothetical protein HYS15_01750 [Candidatus Spechtbacteria bacterium]|nr:hypothetical protein [Candidatus Spechtbacteria bacterium]